MEAVLGQDIPKGLQRRVFIANNCDKTEEKGYMKPYTPEEILGMKDELSESEIILNDLEEEKKAFMEALKLKMKPLLDRKKLILEGIKKKAVFTTEECFKFIDFDERQVGFYNEDGILVESRQAFANELQRTFDQVLRTGTHD